MAAEICVETLKEGAERWGTPAMEKRLVKAAVDCTNNLSKVHVKLGDRTKAKDCIVEALKLDPRSVPSLIIAASITIDTGEWVEAAEALKGAVEECEKLEGGGSKQRYAGGELGRFKIRAPLTLSPTGTGTRSSGWATCCAARRRSTRRPARSSARR